MSKKVIAIGAVVFLVAFSEIITPLIASYWLDSALSRIDQHEDTLEKHDERITNLETGKAWVLGYAVAASGAIGLALQFLFKG